MSSHDPDAAEKPADTVEPPTAIPDDPPPGSHGGQPDSTWLHDFYKECGREITLAYTTLNQMQNWAIVIQAAIAAAVGSFARASSAGGASPSTAGPLMAMVVGASIGYLFTLRFFVRAVICYTNLLRWNTLQKEIVYHRLQRPAGHNDAKLYDAIRVYYHDWRATTSRANQLASNLKLGFSLLFLLPIASMGWGIAELPSSALIRGFVTAAILGTVLEGYHFLRDAWFDDVLAAARRSSPRPGFPGPGGELDHVWGWVGVVAGSLLVSGLPRIL
jgi:hypothetical protein